MPRFYVSGHARVDFTQAVEAATSEEAAKKVREMNVVDLTWDYEDITITDVVGDGEKKP